MIQRNAIPHCEIDKRDMTRIEFPDEAAPSGNRASRKGGRAYATATGR